MFWKNTQPKFCEGEFAIESEPVVSIERRTPSSSTIIGVIGADKESRYEEWYLPVSIEKHNELVARFRRKIGGANAH